MAPVIDERKRFEEHKAKVQKAIENAWKEVISDGNVEVRHVNLEFNGMPDEWEIFMSIEELGTTIWSGSPENRYLDYGDVDNIAKMLFV